MLRFVRLPLPALLLLTGCSGVLRSTRRPQWPPPPDGYFMYVGAFLQVTGTGVAEGPTSSETQRNSLARDAALLDAWERLRGFLEALPHRPPFATVGTKAASSPKYAADIEHLVHSARIVSSRWERDGRAIVILRLLKERVNPALGTELR